MNPWLLAAWIGCQSLDLGSTAWVTHQPGVRESNPFLQGPQGYTLKVSVNIGTFVAVRHAVRQQPHSPVRWAAPTAMATLGCAAGAWNLHLGYTQR